MTRWANIQSGNALRKKPEDIVRSKLGSKECSPAVEIDTNLRSDTSFGVSVFSLGRRALLPFLVMILSLVFETGSLGAAETDPNCFDSESVTVRISDELFSIPIRYRPHITTVTQESISPKNAKTWPHHCAAGASGGIAQPISAMRVSMSFGHREAVRDEKSKPIDGTFIWISRTGRPYSISSAIKDGFEASVRRSERNVKDLSRVDRFYAFEKGEWDNTYIGPFMALPDGRKTPDGYPLVVECRGPAAPNKIRIEKLISFECDVRYLWATGVELRYRFSQREYGINQWSALDGAVTNFFRDIQSTVPK